MRASRVLVTGGCGFIGAHLVRRLVAEGVGAVVILDRLKYGSLSALPQNVSVVRFALGTDDPGGLAEHLAGIDLVFHLAAEKQSQAHPEPYEMLRSNIQGTYALLEAAGRAHVERVVYASSVMAYGRMSGPAMEECERPEPRTVYGVSKLAGEHLMSQAALAHGFSGVCLRYFFVYGPGQLRGTGYRSVIVKNFGRLLAGASPTICGAGEQVLDYVFIDDAIDATVAAATAPVAGEVLNVGSGVGTTIDSLTDRMLALVGTQVEKSFLPPDTTQGSCRVASLDKVRRALGWAPRVGLDEGLARTLDWMKREDWR